MPSSIAVAGPIASFPGLTLVDRPITNSGWTFATVTADATAHTKGAWTQLIASSSAAASTVLVVVKNTFGSTVNSSQLLDIGIGAGGSETVLIPNVGCGWRGPDGAASWGGQYMYFPVSVPAGSRVSARIQSAVAAGDTAEVHVSLFSGGLSGSAVDAIGASTAASKGVDVIAGLSNAEGNWTEITASTSAAYRALLYSVQGAADTGLVAGSALLDIGYGAGGSEVALISNEPILLGASESVTVNFQLPYACSIPAETRLAARLQFDQAGAQSLDVILYGVR